MNIINANLQFTGSLTKRKKTTRLIIHHAAANASVETIHKWHLGRGWCGIGYNFYIRKDGSVYQGRGWEYVGAHCAGYNSTSVGICFEGNYETVDKDMPAEQYNAGVELIRMVLDKYPTITEICGHKAHGATACPGKYFPLDALIAAARGNDGGTTVNVSTGTATSTAYNAIVESLQAAINADGITDAAGRKLAVDGIKGKNTSAAIKKTLLKAGALSNGRYRVGSTGALVKWVQERLNILLGLNLAEDGKYGNDTRAAVLQWQEINNLTQDGIAGVDTITSLLCLG